MQKNSNRKGLALGAAFALVASLFTTAPAQAATDAANFGVYPELGSTASNAFVGLIEEDFPVYFQVKPGNSYSGTFQNDLVIKVEKTAGTNMDLGVSVSSVAGNFNGFDGTQETASFSAKVQAGSTSGTVSATTGGSIPRLNLKVYSSSPVASWSAVTVKITAWLDSQGGAKNDVIDSDEWFTTQTVTLIAAGSIANTLTLTEPNEGDSVVTVSAALSGVNFANLGGKFWLAMSSSNAIYDPSTTSTKVGTEVPAATLALRSGVLSQSFAVVAGSVSATATVSVTVSAAVRYISTSASADMYNGRLVGSVVNKGVVNNTAGTLAVSLVDSDNALSTSGKVRPNSLITFKVLAKDGSVSKSGVAVTVKFTGTFAPATGSKTISINGGAALNQYPASVTVTTGDDGYASWTMLPSGMAATETIIVTATVGNTSATKTVTAEAAAYTVVNDYDRYSTTPGAAVNMTYTVEDQYGVLSPRTDQRIKFTRAGDGFNYAETVSYVAVVGGKASFAFTPSPATKTGSATVATVLERLNTDANVWSTDGTGGGTLTVYVSNVANGFSVSPVASQSASISYFPSTVSYKTVTTTVKNLGSEVEVSGPAALIFRETGKTATASGKLTLRADATGAVSFDVAALLEGTHTITLKAGSASTTSLLVVDPAKGSAGVKISFDKSSINAGETAVITGKVTDANGNPVNTTNTDGASALLVVSYTGKGLPFNTGSSIETDEKGEFKVNVLALAGDAGTGTLTATYRPAGAAVDVNNVTATQTITIVAPAAPAAPEVNAVIGTYNGRWAVRVENAKGATVAVKVGGRWVKYTSLNDNYLFSRKSVVGRSVAVAVYVNGTLENVATINIK